MGFDPAARGAASKAADDLLTTAYDTTFIPITRSINLFNKYTTIDGYFRGYTYGGLSVNSQFFASDFIRIKPNWSYTVNDATQQFNTQVCFFDSNKKYISGTERAVTIVTPANAAFIVLSGYLSYKSIFMFREGTGIGQPYVEPITVNLPDSSIKKSMIETMTTDDLGKIRFAVTLTVDATYTSATTGWGVTTFSSLITAHNSITDASKNKRYKILVNPGSYSDWETVWAGLDPNVNYRGIIVKDYVYFEGTDKYKCILNWDGFAGCTTGYVMTVNECMQKCIFHISGVNTYIKGFTIHTKNSRYCIHPESSGNAINNSWLIQDCELYWEGRPNCVDTTGGFPVGIGLSPSESGTIKNVSVYNAGGLSGIGGHNNPNNNAASPNYGTLTLKDVNANGTIIYFQTISSNGETDYDQLILEDVNNIKFLQLSPSNDVRCKRVNFRATLKGATNPLSYQMWSPDAADRYVPAYPNVMAVINGTTGTISANRPMGIGSDGKGYWFINTSPMNEFAGHTLVAIDAGVYGKIQNNGLLYVAITPALNRFDMLLPDFTVTADKTKATLMVMETKNSSGYYYCKILNSNF